VYNPSYTRHCVTHLVARSDKHDGWCFRIKGQYHSDKAKTVLEDAKLAESTDRIPLLVGLLLELCMQNRNPEV